MHVLAQIAQEIQLFQATDVLTIFTLAILESILSVDNALVLAILVRELPTHQRKKALLYGMAGAFTFRIIAILAASYLIHLRAFKIIGGGYLLYLAMKHMFFFFKEDAHQMRPKAAKNFWQTILWVELTDVVFSIDSITTAVAMTNKISIVWMGGILGIVSLRFMSGYFIGLLEKAPKLEDLAYQIVFFVGIKLTLDAFNYHIDHRTFWMVMGIIGVLGASLIFRDRYQKKEKIQYQDRLLEQLDKGEIQITDLLKLEHVPTKVIQHLQNRGFLELKIPK